MTCERGVGCRNIDRARIEGDGERDREGERLRHRREMGVET